MTIIFEVIAVLVSPYGVMLLAFLQKSYLAHTQKNCSVLKELKMNGLILRTYNYLPDNQIYMVAFWLLFSGSVKLLLESSQNIFLKYYFCFKMKIPF